MGDTFDPAQAFLYRVYGLWWDRVGVPRRGGYVAASELCYKGCAINRMIRMVV